MKMVRSTELRGNYPVPQRGFEGSSGSHLRQFFPPECTDCPKRNVCTDHSTSSDLRPVLAPRFFAKDKSIHAYLQCLGPNPQKSNCGYLVHSFLEGCSLVLNRIKPNSNDSDPNDYTVKLGSALEELRTEKAVSLLNLLNLRVTPESLDEICIPKDIKDDTNQEASANQEDIIGGTNQEASANQSDNTSIMYAQLLLWREEQNENTTSVKQKNEEKRTEYKYQVSLIGVSGPATKALTALLVDDEQKERIWSESQKRSNYLPLNTLQTHIRKAFCTTLRTEIGTGDDDLEIAKALSLTYLSTILSQYFLPFLSKSDEKRIYNSLEAFLRITDSKNDPVFEHAVKKHTDTILSKLEKTLYGFRGVDALYDVKVSAKSNDRDVDNRTIQSIELHEADNKPAINCLYVNPQKS